MSVTGHRRGTVVVTTLGDFADSAPDSVVEAARKVFRHNLRQLHRHGVRLAVGSDGYSSVGVSEAMQLHDLGVFTNRQLLTAWVETTPGTIFPHRNIGRLEPGYEASFLVLEGNPLMDFFDTQKTCSESRTVCCSHLPTGPVNLSAEVPGRQPEWARATLCRSRDRAPGRQTGRKRKRIIGLRTFQRNP